MDDEQIENQLYPTKLVQDLGFQSLNHFHEFCMDAIAGSESSPDPFIRNLGDILHHADLKQAVRLIWAFNEDLQYCAMSWRMLNAKKIAEEEETRHV